MNQEYNKDTLELQEKADNNFKVLTSSPKDIDKLNSQYGNISRHGYNVLNQNGIIECEIISSEDLLFNPEEDFMKSHHSSEDKIYTSGKFDFGNPDKTSSSVPSSKELPSSDPSDLYSDFINQSGVIDAFESVDGKPLDEGFFVTLDGTKIRKVRLYDNYVLGVTMKDLNNKQKPLLTDVIICGRALVKDDGTCIPNGYCLPNGGGIATNWNYGYRVMERKGPNEILILIK